MTLINELINKGIFKPAPPPRDAWALGTAQGAPSAGLVSVIIDGDTDPVTIATAVTTATSDRVLTCLLGLSRMVVANLTSPAGSMTAAQILAALLTVDGAGSGLDADNLDGVGGGYYARKDGDNEMTSGKFTRWGHANQTDGNDGKIGAALFASGLNIVGTQTTAAEGRRIRIWGDLLTSGGSKYWHEGNDGSDSGLDADTCDGSHYSAADVLSKLLTVDGASSGIDADKLDGVEGSGYATVTAGADWTPSYSCNGSMTITSVSTTKAKHYHFGELIWIDLEFTGTLGGTVSNGVRFTLPHAMASGGTLRMGGEYSVTNDYALNVIEVSGSTTTAQILRVDSTTNYVAGTGRYFHITGWYKPA